MSSRLTLAVLAASQVHRLVGQKVSVAKFRRSIRTPLPLARTLTRRSSAAL